MADFVTNKLTIKLKDENQIEKIKNIILRYNEINEPIFTMTKFLPCPEGYSENPTYTDIGYDWFNAVWGTKWDVRYSEILESGNSITITYDTAWNPNQPWVFALCRFIHHISFSLDKQEFKEVSVKHFFVDEYEDFGTLVTWTFIDNNFDIVNNISVSSQLL